MRWLVLPFWCCIHPHNVVFVMTKEHKIKMKYKKKRSIRHIICFQMERAQQITNVLCVCVCDADDGGVLSYCRHVHSV